jgi:hypothetical protein
MKCVDTFKVCLRTNCTYLQLCNIYLRKTRNQLKIFTDPQSSYFTAYKINILNNNVFKNYCYGNAPQNKGHWCCF